MEKTVKMKKTEDRIREAGIKACILYNCTQDEIIYEYNKNLRLPMASVTKLITALTVRECVPEPDKVFFTVDEGCISYIINHSGSAAGFNLFIGERYSVTEYLKGLFISSGCDAAYILAKNLGDGDDRVFVKKMNDFLARIGCTDTHVTDASGFENGKEHYTTVNDLCRIMSLAMQDLLLREILMTNCHITASKTKWTMRTIDPLLRCQADTFFPYCIGGKTGTTNAAGRCYCGVFKRGGEEYIFAELGANCDFSEKQRRWLSGHIIAGIFCDFLKESGPFMRVSFPGNYIVIPAGTTFKLEVQTLFNNTKEPPRLSFFSLNPEIATVDNEGKITVCGKGVAQIEVYTQTGDYDLLFINSTGEEYVELKRIEGTYSF